MPTSDQPDETQTVARPTGSRMIASSHDGRVTIYAAPRRHREVIVASVGFAGVWTAMLIWLGWLAISHSSNHLPIGGAIFFFGVFWIPALFALGAALTNWRETFTLTANTDSILYVHQYMIGRKVRTWRRSQFTRLEVGRPAGWRVNEPYQLRIRLSDAKAHSRQIIEPASRQEMAWVVQLISKPLAVSVDLDAVF